MTSRTRRLAGACAAAAFAIAAVPATADDGGRPLYALMTGAQEAPGPGDPDGSGLAVLHLNPGQGELCYELSVTNIAPATASHVHIAPPGSPGPVVVPLAPPTSGASAGCADVDRDLLRAIIRDPGAYYVNVHNAEYPGGAVRGQLTKPGHR